MGKNLSRNSWKKSLSWRNFGKQSELCQSEIHEGIAEIPEVVFEKKNSELFGGEIFSEKSLEFLGAFLKKICEGILRKIAEMFPSGTLEESL